MVLSMGKLSYVQAGRGGTSTETGSSTTVNQPGPGPTDSVPSDPDAAARARVLEDTFVWTKPGAKENGYFKFKLLDSMFKSVVQNASAFVFCTGGLDWDPEKWRWNVGELY